MSRASSERRNKEQKKTISATIGYCFVIVLVVLLVAGHRIKRSHSVSSCKSSYSPDKEPEKDRHSDRSCNASYKYIVGVR